MGAGKNQADLFQFDPEAELAFAKTLPNGMELSPAAQALYEKEGAERFRKFHSRALPIAKREGK